MKQKVIISYRGDEVKRDIENALYMGWKVQSVTVNSETNMWVVILYKDEVS